MASSSLGVEVTMFCTSVNEPLFGSQTEYERKKMNDEGYCNCTSCGEEIRIPIVLSDGLKQEYVQNCAICRNPNVIHVEVEHDGDVRVWVTTG